MEDLSSTGLPRPVSEDGEKKKNIRDRLNRSLGNIDKIVSTLSERPYGAYQITREGILIGWLLKNVKSWINITQKNNEDFERKKEKRKENITKKSFICRRKSEQSVHDVRIGHYPCKICDDEKLFAISVLYTTTCSTCFTCSTLL